MEFGFTSSIYFFVLFGVFQVSLWLWTDFALHRGVEAAARCAAVTPTICSTVDSIKSHARAQSYGLNVPVTSFTVNATASCGVQVSGTHAAFDFTQGLGLGAFTASATACYPK